MDMALGVYGWQFIQERNDNGTLDVRSHCPCYSHDRCTACWVKYQEYLDEVNRKELEKICPSQLMK